MSLKILLVEDDPVLGTGLSVNLKLEGYQVTWVKDSQTASGLFSMGAFDLVSLDIGLPDGSGIDLCKSFRLIDSKVPIIFLTAKTDEETLLRGLSIGGNDFIKKPFSQKELLARIKVLLRSNITESGSSFAGLTLFPERREIFFEGKHLPLNRRQYEILAYFLVRPDQIITRDQLVGYLGQDGAIFDRTIDSHVSQVRKAIKASHVSTIQITSIYGVGYRLELL